MIAVMPMQELQLNDPTGLKRQVFRLGNTRVWVKRYSRDDVHREEWGYDGEATLTWDEAKRHYKTQLDAGWTKA